MDPRNETTDKQLRAATVGELQEHAGPIELADYDPSWPERFAAVARATTP
ncbi:MAG: hypothetical protein ACXVQS_13060 [Actinomycetota bacterium]